MALLLQNQLGLYYCHNKCVNPHNKKKYICKLNYENEKNNWNYNCIPIINALNVFAQDELNTITTAVPFLLIGPDARAGAMGDVGVATTPDVNSMHWNPAKLSYLH